MVHASGADAYRHVGVVPAVRRAQIRRSSMPTPFGAVRPFPHATRSRRRFVEAIFAVTCRLTGNCCLVLQQLRASGGRAQR